MYSTCETRYGKREVRWSRLIHHLTGFGGREAVEQAYGAARITAKVDSFVDEIASVYAAASFVIACPGALTLAEIAAAGLPSLLVPGSGVAGDHQAGNARLYAAHTGAPWVPEHEWNAQELAVWIESLLRGTALLDELRRRALDWSRPHAARDVVRVCENLLASRG